MDWPVELGSSSVGHRSSIISFVFSCMPIIGPFGLLRDLLFYFVLVDFLLLHLDDWKHWLVSSHAANSWNIGNGWTEQLLLPLFLPLCSLARI
ncbi:hypothetical protein Nepgr_002607 [Nepenthes gracilis]|uniref:Uncharacterized protein n=1 Tax=Nepenthes gracilis TaxID=150966 RepID=A0AAD3RYC5_NEPGR|nr:hypothetical protein Nepgr_002607 [Nepenthes gracilis]